jgi:hypothetical protein
MTQPDVTIARHQKKLTELTATKARPHSSRRLFDKGVGLLARYAERSKRSSVAPADHPLLTRPEFRLQSPLVDLSDGPLSGRSGF